MLELGHAQVGDGDEVVRGAIAAVVRGMTDNRSNAFVEAMNGLLQQAKRAARGYRTTHNFIDRLLAHVQAQASTSSSVRARPGQMRLSRSTRNDIEPPLGAMDRMVPPSRSSFVLGANRIGMVPMSRF